MATNYQNVLSFFLFFDSAIHKVSETPNCEFQFQFYKQVMLCLKSRDNLFILFEFQKILWIFNEGISKCIFCCK